MSALAVVGALSALRPTDRETALLAACLRDGEAAREGWLRWLGGREASDAALCHELARWRTLLPLLARSASRHGLDVGGDVRSYLRAAALREELRAERYRSVAVAAFSALDRAGVGAFAVRGAALAATVYDAWALRHCHDLDLLLDGCELEAARCALRSAGFGPASGEARPGEAALEHTSGLQVSLHTRPFAPAYHDAPLDGFVRGSRRILVEDTLVRTPSPEATLVHVLGHAAFHSSRRTLHWVADAWHLLARHADFDWEDVQARIAAHRLDIPLSVLLAWLAGFGAPVPADAVDRVRERAARAESLAEDVALGGIAASARGDLVHIWRSTPSWRGRLRFARWVLAPSRAYLQGALGAPADWRASLWYVVRPARFLAGRMAASPRAPGPGRGRV